MKQAFGSQIFPFPAVPCRPAWVDLRVLAVLGHIVIEEPPAGGEAGHDKVAVLRAAVGERNRGTLIGLEQFQ